MCMDPVSMGLMAGGMAMSMGGSLIDSNQSAARTSAMMGARQKAVADEIGRNEALSREAMPILNNQVASMTPEAQAQAQSQAAANRIAAGQAPGVMPMTVNGAPPVVNQEVGRLAKMTADRVAENAKKKAALDAYGDVQSNNAVDLSQSSNKIGTLGSFAKGNAAVFPAVLQSDEFNAAKGFNSPLGSIMKGAGQLVSLGGAMGAGGWGAGTAPEGNVSNFPTGGGPQGPSGGSVAPSRSSWFSWLGR